MFCTKIKAGTFDVYSSKLSLTFPRQEAYFAILLIYIIFLLWTPNPYNHFE